MLAFTSLVLVSCAETSTEPEMAQAANPALAVASNTWITRANLPNIEREGLATAVVPNASGQSILYAIGGRSISTRGSLGKVQAYNATTNTWSDRASLPIAAYWTNGAGVIGGKIYISGGETRDKFFRNELHMYNPTTDTWTRKRDMPGVTWGGITGVINNQLYVLTCVDEDLCWQHSHLVLYRYNPATDQWAQLSVTPVGLGFPMGGVIGGKLYATGGPSGGLLVYDPATNGWTSKASLPGRRWNGAGVALAGKLYILGGFEQDGDDFRLVRKTSVYDPATNTWSNKAVMPTHRRHFSASRVVVDGQARIDAVGGVRPGNNLQYTP